MAFKKVDFSKLNRGRREPESPYQYHDEMHFARNFRNDRLCKLTVTVGLDQRRITMGLDDLAIPASKDETRYELVLKGERARDWDATVHQSLSNQRQTILGAVEDLRDADWERADGVTADIEIEGFFKKRSWKDRAGAWHSVWQIHVARFVFDGVEKGRIPEMK